VNKLHIQNEMVRRNIALIVDTIRQQRKLSQRETEQRQKTLKFTIDLKTGELATGGKAVEIHFDLDKHQVVFTEVKEMDPKGRQVLSETCHYLQSTLMHLHDIHEFAQLELEPTVQEINDRNLLKDAWHAIGREEAELMLLNASKGTYLFRKDHFASVMEEIISGAKKMSVRCITLSYLDPEGQVRDRTIVNWKDHWLFYDDDPMLSGRYFTSLEQLLSSMGPVLKRSLPALRSA